MKTRAKTLAGVCALLLALTACEICDPTAKPDNRIRLATFRLPAEGEATAVDTFFSAVYGLGNPFDSTLYTTEDTLGSFRLPLPIEGTEGTFVFENLGGEPDTLVLGFSVRVVPLPPECGFFEQYENIAVRSTTFDSVRVNRASASADEDVVNLELYFPTP